MKPDSPNIFRMGQADTNYRRAILELKRDKVFNSSSDIFSTKNDWFLIGSDSDVTTLQDRLDIYFLIPNDFYAI